MEKFSKKQKEVITWWCVEEDVDGIIADGAIRSGKTVSMICGFLFWSQKTFSNKDFIIAGRTMSSLKRNVVNPMLSIVKYDMGWEYDYNRSENFITIGSNKYYLFGASSEAAQDVLQGMTAAGCLADEVALFPQSFVDQMTARCSISGSKLWFNCNPSYPLHFFKTEYIDRCSEKKLKYLHFMLDDNLTLSPDIKERYERMYHGVFYDRYIKGMWKVAEGLVYQIEESEYVVDKKAAMGEGNGMWYVSIDYGITNPFAALLWRVTPDCAYLVEEYYFDSKAKGYRKTDREHYESLVKMVDGRNIEAVIIDPSATSFKQEIWRDGRYYVYDANNSVLDGIALTDQMLHDGSIKVCNECYSTISERQMYCWDDKAKKDQVIKENDHAMDAMRYMANTQLKYLLKGYDV